MIVELRTYRLKTGTRERFFDIFRAKTMPEHNRLGMPILGPLLSIEDADVFFFMRGFCDEASREPTKARFYDGKLWKDELEEIMMPMIERYDVVVVDDSQDRLGWDA